MDSLALDFRLRDFGLLATYCVYLMLADSTKNHKNQFPDSPIASLTSNRAAILVPQVQLFTVCTRLLIL